MKKLYFILISLALFGLIIFLGSLIALNKPLNEITMIIIFGSATFIIGYLIGKIMNATKNKAKVDEK